MNDMNGEKTAQVIATAGSRRGLQLPKLSRDVVANRSISIRAGATTSVSVRHQLTLECTSDTEVFRARKVSAVIGYPPPM